MIVLAVEGDTEEIGFGILLDREFPGARVGPRPRARIINFQGNRRLLKGIARTVEIEAADRGCHVLAVLDLKGLGGAREDADQVCDRFRRHLLGQLPPERQSLCSVHVLRHEIEAVYLTQPGLLGKLLGIPADAPLFDQPEKVNGEQGVWSHLAQLCRDTPGARTPTKTKLARLVFRDLDVERTGDKMPSFHALWVEVRERMTGRA